MNSFAEIEQFSKTVELIYDAAIDQTLWPKALQHIVNIIGGDVAGIHFGDLEAYKLTPSLAHTFGFSDSFVNKMQEYAHVWAVQSGLPFWQVGEMRHLPDILPREEFLNGRFYKEALVPEKHDDYIGMLAVKDGTQIVPLTLGTLTSTGSFKPRGVEIARLLAPHICKSAKIGFALELQSLKINQLEATLDGLGAGIYLIHRDGRLVFMNRVAEQQIKRGQGVAILNNRLVPKNSEAATQFLHSLSADNENTFSPVSIALPNENGGLIATILRLDKGRRQNLATGSVFAVFVQNPEVALPIPGESFAKLYGLTQAEMRIMMAMAPGLGPQDAADILGISLSTVKTHLQSVFSKTRTHRQADLMQLLMRASAPIAAE